MPKPFAPCGTIACYRRGCRCDACRAAKAVSTAKYAEKSKAQQEAWRNANPDRVRANNKAWKNDHRTKVREINLRSYHKRMEEDPESIRANRRRAAQTEKGQLYNRLAAHRRRGVTYDDEARAYVEILLHDPCSYCGQPGTEIDHITPVSLGGNGEWMNLTSSCRTCNAQKNDDPLLAFVRSAA